MTPSKSNPTSPAATPTSEFRRLEAVLLGLLFGVLIISMAQTVRGLRHGLHDDDPRTSVAVPGAVAPAAARASAP